MYASCIACFAFVISLARSKIMIETMDKLENSTTNATIQSLLQDDSHLTEEFLDCLKIKVMPGDYELLDNATLYVPAYERFSSKGLQEYGNYYIDRSNESFPIALICLPFDSNSEQKVKYQEENILISYITIIGTSISLLCLVLHFIAFLIVPEMKNLPGKNLASLCVSIFFAYLLFLVGKIIFDRTPTCYPLGICIYYFMMVSFFWMNAISYDIFKSVRSATTKLRLMSKYAEFKHFIFYSLYSWLTPAVLTGIVIAGDLTTLLPEEIRPKFDERRCWLRQRLSIITFFASPMAVLMLANVAFFVASAVAICSHSMKSDDFIRNLRRHLILYIKLAVIMGFVWIIGLVSDLVENDALSYVFISLVTLQGLFIFIAFTRFKKVANHLKERLSIVLRSTFSTSNYDVTQSNLATATDRIK